MSNFLVPILLLIDGIVFIVAAVFAQAFGLDPSAGWGRIRILLLLAGILLFISALILFFFKDRKAHFVELSIESEGFKTAFLLVHLWAFISLVYAGFITYGNFTTWDRTTHYYTQLADAFAEGKLYVDREPDQSLLEAEDPYDVDHRLPFDDEIWDLSLYKEKLYLYWGAVPALLILPFQIILDKKITDNYPVFFFSVGLLIFNSLIILRLWKKFFPQLPARYVFICIPLIGLILPILWATNIPNVYEAAIGAGQFFLIGGIYFSLSIFEGETGFDKKSLFLAGLFWALSVGSRAINALAVIFFVLVIAFWAFKKLPKPILWSSYIHALLRLFVPLVAGAMIIGWYNWARFDSPLEFGLRYQITIFNLNKDIELVFEPNYFFLNLYTYIFHPYQVISGFPFIQPTVVSRTLKEFNITTSEFYHAGKVTGLLFSTPFLFLGFVNLFSKNKLLDTKDSNDLSESYNFVLTLLGGSFLINFLILLFYFYGQTRFLVDFISQVTLLAILGYWHIVSRKSKLWITLANVLIIITICTSILLTFSGETNRFQTLNPQFFETINEFLNINK